jgi:hypothetical protein
MASRLEDGMTFTLKEWPAGRLHRLAELWPDPTWSVWAVARELGVSIAAVQRQAKQLACRDGPGIPASRGFTTRLADLAGNLARHNGRLQPMTSVG